MAAPGPGGPGAAVRRAGDDLPPAAPTGPAVVEARHPRHRTGRSGGDTFSGEWGRLILRGLTKRCPNCGGRRLFSTWFHMKERCPTCGIRFEREPGFFVGAYLINFAISIVLLFVLCMGYVAMKAIDPDAGVTGPLAVGIVVGIAAPPFCYPFSKTIWSAIDVAMTPLEPEELADAEHWLTTRR